jgi:hypothetical protein
VQGKKALQWADEFTLSFNRLKESASGAFNAVGQFAAPSITAMMDRMTGYKAPGSAAPVASGFSWSELMRGAAIVGGADAATGDLLRGYALPAGRTSTLAPPGSAASAPAAAASSAGGADAALNKSLGYVEVHVNVANAPPGTTVQARSSSGAQVRISRSMSTEGSP